MADKSLDRSQESRSSNRGVTRRGTTPLPGLFESSPFSLIRRMHDEMDRIFSESFGGMGSAPRFGGGLMGWSPAVEVREKGNSLIVCADLPGLSQDDIEVHVTDDALVIQGERKHEEEETTEEGLRRSERSYGRFYRTIPLPQHAKTEQVKARFDKGVLEITIPTDAEKTSQRRIQIEGGAK